MEIDRAMMERCIELSRLAARKGEHPFAALIAREDRIVAEAINQVAAEGDVTKHAEHLAISAAQQSLPQSLWNECTLYTTVEPCPMCSFPAREMKLRRIVFAIASPVMGGLSRWGILSDPKLSDLMPTYFGPPPAITSGVLREEAEAVWAEWNPELWRFFRERGCF